MESFLNMKIAKRRKLNIGKHFSETVLGSRPGTSVGIFGVKTTLSVMGTLYPRVITLMSFTCH